MNELFLRALRLLLVGQQCDWTPEYDDNITKLVGEIDRALAAWAPPEPLRQPIPILSGSKEEIETALSSVMVED